MKDKLMHYNKTFITLHELEQLMGEARTYEQFAQMILSLQQEGSLQPVKSAGVNNKEPALAYKYKIFRHTLKKDHIQEIDRYQLTIHPLLSLDTYYALTAQQWEQDLPFIKQINRYFLENGLPQSDVPAPERSQALVGDEKWIQHKGGQKLLDRLKVWELLRVVPVHDPLSFAINPSRLLEPQQLHLIVENKTTYDGLLSTLPQTIFSTLIYGQGNKISKSIEHFSRQLPIPSANHTIYYFGDIDWAGIAIWHRVHQKMPVYPAVPFYKASLDYKAKPIPTRQQQNEEAMTAFLQHFDPFQQQKIKEILESNCYLAQEVLSSNQLQSIWSESTWKHHLST